MTQHSPSATPAATCDSINKPIVSFIDSLIPKISPYIPLLALSFPDQPASFIPFLTYACREGHLEILEYLLHFFYLKQQRTSHQKFFEQQKLFEEDILDISNRCADYLNNEKESESDIDSGSGSGSDNDNNFGQKSTDTAKGNSEQPFSCFILSRCMTIAAARNHLHIVQFLHSISNECFYCDNAECNNHYNNFQSKRHDQIFENTSCRYSFAVSKQSMDIASAHGHLEIVQFLHDNRPEGCTKLAMDLAAMYGHLDVVRFLDEYRDEGCTKMAMDMAAMNGWQNVVKYLMENREEGCSMIGIINCLKAGRRSIYSLLRGQFLTA